MLATPTVETACSRLPTAGAAAPSVARARQEAQSILKQEGLVREAWSFRVYEITAIRGELIELGNKALRIPAHARLRGRMTSLAAAACTLGPGLEARISALFQARQPLVAMALDDLATGKLFLSSDRVYARIRREARRLGLHTGDPQNPGDPGMALDEQRSVLGLSGMGAQISANAAGMLHPVKSLCFVVPLGAHLPAHGLSPRCARCASRDSCHLKVTPK